MPSASTTKGTSQGIALSDLPDDAAQMLRVLDTDGDGVLSQREIHRAQLKHQDSTAWQTRMPSLRTVGFRPSGSLWSLARGSWRTRDTTISLIQQMTTSLRSAKV